MKHFFSLIFFVFSCSLLLAQVPAGYYNAAVGKSGEELRTALFNIIKNHTAIEYGDLWNAYRYTDVMGSGKVWDIYSDVPDGTAAYYFNFGTDQCGSYSQEGACYNREHSIPQSWFNEMMPMKTDLFHLYPTDGFVNNKRGNVQYGKVNTPSWTSTNGSKFGPCSYAGCTGNAFEPINAFKGDLARTYFYMTVRYKDKNLGQASESVFTGSQLKSWAQNMFVEWHTLDPVSQKEIDRNDVIYNRFQHNRNPFIDCPELVDFLFGAHQNDPWYPTCVDWDDVAIDEYHLADYQNCKVYPNPTAHHANIESNYLNISMIEVYNTTGQCLQKIADLNTKHYELSTSDLIPGCYFIRIHTNKTSEIIKLMVQ